MNTKSEAVYHFQRVANVWAIIGSAAVGGAILLVLYILHLHIALSNCYAG